MADLKGLRYERPWTVAYNTFMPVFEYVCKSCSKQFETLVRGADQPACPDCGGEQLEKLFSVFATAVAGPRASAAPSVGPCGSCGDPRGPGSCSLN